MKLVVLSLIFSLFLLSTSIVSAQEMSSESAGLNPTPTVEYTLPYPGILPDNPIYPIKALRDRMVSLLIGDPLKKSLFNLLQADKRLQSAVYLLYTPDEKHIQLAESTISKGQNYFEEAVSQIEVARKRGKPISAEVRQLILASEKHEEVLTNLKEQVPDKEKNAFTFFIQRIVRLRSLLVPLQQAK